MRVKTIFTNGKELLLAAFTGFSNDRAMKLSASLAYYTIFSLAPLLIVLISAASLIYGKEETIQSEVFNGINELAGREAAIQIQQDRKSTRLNSSHVKISYAVFCLKKKITKLLTHFLTND